MKRKMNQKKHRSKAFAGLLAGLLAGGALFLLVACAGDAVSPYDSEKPESPASGEFVPLSLDVSLESAHLTRVTSALDKGSIGVFRTAPVATYCPAQYNVQYEYKSSAWQATAPDNKILVGGEDASLHAYYPYNSVTFDTTVKTQTTLTVKDYKEADDLCYAAAPTVIVNNKNLKASFVLKHAYARLRFSIKRNADYPTACKITKIVMQPVTVGSILHTTRTMDIAKAAADGALLGGTIVADWTPDIAALTMCTAGIAKDATNTEIDKLFPPQAFTSSVDMKLTFTIDGLDYTTKIPNTTLPALKAGEAYTVKLEMQGKGIDWTGVNITRDWTTSPVGSGDKDATFD